MISRNESLYLTWELIWRNNWQCVSPWHQYSILSLCILRRYLWNDDILRRMWWRLRLTTVCIIVPCQIKCASIYEFLESSSKKDTIQGLHKNVLNPTKGLLQINSLLIVFLNERLIRYPQSGCGPSNQVLVSASQGTHPTILGQLDKMALSHSLWSSDWSMRLPSSPLIGQ